METGNTNNDLLTAKGVAMGCLFAASMFLGTLPFLLARFLNWNTDGIDGRPERHRIVSLALAGGGGILLATTFLHLLPEVRDTIEVLQENGGLPETSFSLAEVLMCLGFFIIYAVSEVVHGYIKRINAANASSATNPPKNNDIDANAPDDNYHSHVVVLHSHSEECTDTVATAMRGLLIVLALSVHELFEGMALGLEGHVEHVWLLFGAISAHKLVLAFCVGIELMVARTQLWLAICYVAVFAVVSPLGIGIGMLVTGGGFTTAATSMLVSGVLQAIATGTLMYVVFFEILKKGGAGLLQLAAVVLGFAVMFGLQQLSGHEHSHEDEDGHEGHSHDH